MKKGISNALIMYGIFLVLAIVLGVFSEKFIFNDEGTYTEGDFSFKSTMDFVKSDYEGYDVYFENTLNQVLVFGIKEGKTYLSDLGFGELSLDEYANVIYTNENDTTSKLKYRENEGYYYFSYEYTLGEDDIYYLAAMFEGPENFWLISFACLEEEKEEYENNFFTWADSVKVKN